MRKTNATSPVGSVLAGLFSWFFELRGFVSSKRGAQFIGLTAGLPGFPFQNQSNVDALEIIPEPATLGMLLLGVGIAAAMRRRLG